MKVLIIKTAISAGYLTLSVLTLLQSGGVAH